MCALHVTEERITFLESKLAATLLVQPYPHPLHIGARMHRSPREWLSLIP